MALQISRRSGVAVAAVLFMVAGSVVVDGFAPRSGLSSVQRINTEEQETTSSALFMARRNMNMNRRAPPKEKKPPMNAEIAPGDLRVTTPNAKGGNATTEIRMHTSKSILTQTSLITEK